MDESTSSARNIVVGGLVLLASSVIPPIFAVLLFCAVVWLVWKVGGLLLGMGLAKLLGTHFLYRNTTPLLGKHLTISATKSGFGHAWHFGRWTFGHSARGVRYGSAHVWKGLSQRWFR